MVDYSISNGICILRLNNPPANAINFQVLEALCLAVNRANTDNAAHGIIITGTNDQFSAGADVAIFEKIKTADEAKRTSRLFQEAFDAIETSQKPIAAAVVGTVMGGALELSMACHFRICAHGCRFGMSEIKLGINPGAGGTQRLPRLVGLEAALEMLLTGRPIGSDDALDLGLVDAVCEKDRLVETCRNLIESSPRPIDASNRTNKVSDKPINEKAFLNAQKHIQSMRPENIAAAQIIEAVKIGLLDSYKAGLIKEQEAFAQCMETSVARNLIYLFFATRKTGKPPAMEAVKTKSINRVAVIGMGSMGSGIAQAFAIAGKSVIVLDADTRMAEKGLQGIKASLERKVRRGAITWEKALDISNCFTPIKSIDEIGQVGLIIEAVFENIQVKQSLIEQINNVCSPDAIIASNTSTINLDLLAEKLTDPGRLVGLHFFNPAHSMPIVEVVQCKATRPDIIATAMKCVKDLRKTPILVKNSVGFAVNRIFIPYFMEAFQLLEEGNAPQEIDAAMKQFGFPMGPLSTMDMTGIDILAMSDLQMQAAFPYHLPLPRATRELVAQGLLGQKTGAGVYKYGKGGISAEPNDQLVSIIDRVRLESGIVPRAINRDAIIDRLVMRLIGEAFRVFEEGIVLKESDLDVASVLAAGFPDFRGGVMKYAHEIGMDTVKTRLDTLAGQLGDRFRPCSYLLKKTGE